MSNDAINNTDTGTVIVSSSDTETICVESPKTEDVENEPLASKTISHRDTRNSPILHDATDHEELASSDDNQAGPSTVECKMASQSHPEATDDR